MEKQASNLTAVKKLASAGIPNVSAVINDFFDQYNIDECQSEIWSLLTAAFSGSDIAVWGQRCSGDTVFFCKNVDDLLKGLYRIWLTDRIPPSSF